MNDTLENANIFIGTPAFGGQVYTNYVNTILQLSMSGLRFSLYQITNDALVTRARNTLITEFHRHGASTHLLFLDADVGIPPQGIARLLQAGKDAIGARVALKTFDAGGRMLYSHGEILAREGELGVVDRIATGALLLSRKAVDALVEEADTYEIPDQGTFYDVCKAGAVGNEYVSEDHWLCDALTARGFKIYVDTSIPTIHAGTFFWDTRRES